MSTTIEIPGGTAEIFTGEELTPRRRQPITALSLRSQSLIKRLANARKVTSPTGEVEESDVLDGPDVELTDKEAELLTLMQPAVVWAYLKSWTLDRPLPKNPDEVLDMPQGIYNAISAACVAEQQGTLNQFEPNEASLEDENSPTGASEG